MLNAARQLDSGRADVHACELVHSDLKSANVLIFPDGQDAAFVCVFDQKPGQSLEKIEEVRASFEKEPEGPLFAASVGDFPDVKWVLMGSCLPYHLLQGMVVAVFLNFLTMILFDLEDSDGLVQTNPYSWWLELWCDISPWTSLCRLLSRVRDNDVDEYPWWGGGYYEQHIYLCDADDLNPAKAIHISRWLLKCRFTT